MTLEKGNEEGLFHRFRIHDFTAGLTIVLSRSKFSCSLYNI